ncbi:MAG: transporter ATP-binding protein [Hyphomicrobiales bacterium]|nr:transporter ATP-binding protein [Hyphomicrobiales bacterium]
MLTVSSLQKSFATDQGRLNVIDDVSFDVPEGQCYALLGPSGCGKTTTLRCVAGLEEPDSGRIEIAGRVVYDSALGINVPTHQRPIGIVFQSYAIWPHMDVFENVAYPLRVARPRIPKAEIEQRVMDVLALVGMKDVARRPAPRLSGGQQQRVALARAIVRRPALLLLDEPLSNLDAMLREQMRKELADLIARIGVTALFVTHDQAEALSLAARVAVMHKGKIAQEGAPRDIYSQPRNVFVAEFLGASNILDGRIISSDGAQALVEVGAGQRLRAKTPLPAGSAIKLLLRPERLSVSLHKPVDDSLRAQVSSVGFTGPTVDCSLTLDGAPIRVVAPADTPIKAGDEVWLTPLDRNGMVLAA